MQFLVNTNYEFINHRRAAFIISAILIALGLLSIVFHRGLNYSIDFRGGSELEVRFDEPVPLEDLRGAVASLDLGSFELQDFGDPREIRIGVEGTSESGELGGVLVKLFQERFPDRKVELRREESVGPKIGAELRKNAFYAIGIAVLCILAYISWRFEFRFAVAAVIALIHDVLITLGFFSVMDREISLAVIAAFLTIVGYSLNDTIVVFDRIREDLRLYSRQQYDRILNTAINRTLSRTLLTSGTTLVVVLFLLVLGGMAIRDLAVALLVGVLVGTYSSIFVASPILVEWYDWATARARSRIKARL